MFFTIWYGVYNQNSSELIYASGGHPPALLFDNSESAITPITLLRTPNYVIGGMPDANYEKNRLLIGGKTKLYVFSDGVYEVEKSDGSMWQFKEFADFMAKVRTDGRSDLDHLYQYALNLGNIDKFEDDFTIVEIAFA